jgi:hypothetical protein
MGCPLSFPILCIANLSTYLRLKDIWRREDMYVDICGMVRPRRLKINGDDMLFVGRRDEIPVWRHYASELGLRLSPGKNYVSSEFFMINSRMMYNRRGKMSKIGYYNQGLVSGHRLKSEPVRTLGTFAANCRSLVDGVPADIADRAIGRYLVNNHDLVVQLSGDKGFCFTPNRFLPLAFGGLGLEDRYPDRKFYLTLAQRRVATVLWKNPLERVIFERFNDCMAPYGGQPKAVSLALRMVRRLYSGLKVRSEWRAGPIPFALDFSAVVNSRLSLILANYQWIRGDEDDRGFSNIGVTEGYVSRVCLKRILQMSEGTPFRASKIKNLSPGHLRIEEEAPRPWGGPQAAEWVTDPLEEDRHLMVSKLEGYSLLFDVAKLLFTLE